MDRQFILVEREVIAQMVSAVKRPGEIARRLGRHRASITRELQRGGTKVSGTDSTIIGIFGS